MTPTHHVPEELLLEYVGGVTCEADSLAVACHLTLCGPCQSQAAEHEAVAGALLAASDGAAVSPDLLDRALARLDAPPRRDQDAEAKTSPAPVELPLPRPLLRYLGGARAIPWTSLAPGIGRVALPTSTRDVTTALYRFAPGLELPRHSHKGPEYAVVLTGMLQEDDHQYRRGDMSYAEPGKRHCQISGKDEPCVALVINHGPLVPMTLRGKLFNLLLAIRG